MSIVSINGQLKNYSRKNGITLLDNSTRFTKSMLIECMLYYIEKQTGIQGLLVQKHGTFYKSMYNRDKIEETVKEYFKELEFKNWKMTCIPAGFFNKSMLHCQVDIKKEVYNKEYKELMINFLKLVGII